MTQPALFNEDGDDLAGRCVLFLLPTLEDLPQARMVLSIAEALIAAGGRAIVASDGGALVGDLQARGAEAIDMPLAGSSPLRLIRNGFALRRLIRADRIDLIHALARGPAWSALMARQHGRPPLVTGWNSAAGPSGVKGAYGSVLLKGNAIILSSDHARAEVLREAPNLAGRIHVIPRALVTKSESTAAIPPQRIAAIRQTWQLEGDAQAILVADRQAGTQISPLARSMEAHLLRHGAATLKFIPVESVQDMPAALRAATALVIVREKPDDFVRLAVEAQLSGTPVMVAGAGGASESLRAPPETPSAERTGWRIAEGDAAGLALAFAELLTMRASQRGEMAQRAAQHAQRAFGADQLAVRVLGLYRMLLRNG